MDATSERYGKEALSLFNDNQEVAENIYHGFKYEGPSAGRKVLDPATSTVACFGLWKKASGVANFSAGQNSRRILRIV